MTYILIIFGLIIVGSGTFFLLMNIFPVEIAMQRWYLQANYPKVIEYYEKNKNTAQKKSKARYLCGLSHYNLKDQRSALLVLVGLDNEKDFASSVDIKKYYEVVADSYFNLGSFKNSFYYYFKLIQIEPKQKKALFTLSRLYAAAGQLKKSIIFLKELKNLDPKFADGYYYSGFILFIQRSFYEAKQNFEIFSELTPKHADVHLFIAMCEIVLKNYRDAIDNLRIIIDKTTAENKRLEAIRLMGNVYQRLDNPKIAADHYEKYLKNRKLAKREFAEDTLYNMMIAYFKLGRKDIGYKTLDVLFLMNRNYKDINDMMYNKENLLSTASFNKILETWNGMCEFLLPEYLIDNEIFISKDFSVREVEIKLGIVNKGNKKQTFNDYIQLKYQDWVIVNESLLSKMGFTSISLMSIDNDPDLFNGTGAAYTASKVEGSQLITYFIKFSRNSRISAEYYRKLLDRKDDLKFDRLLLIHNGTFPMEIVNNAEKRKDADLLNQKGLTSLFEKFILESD